MADEDETDDDFERRIRLLAARRAQEIVLREGAALALSARDLDEHALAADSQLLAIAIAQAIVDAYAGYRGGDEYESGGEMYWTAISAIAAVLGLPLAFYLGT